jgi:hypothetical protein
MSDSSYLKQLAARTSGHLPILRPPKSPFPQLGTRQIIESFSEQTSLGVQMSFSPPIQSTMTISPNISTVEKTGELSPQLPIELPEEIASNIPAEEKTRELSPQSPLELPEIKTVSPASTVSWQNLTELNSPPAFEEKISATRNLASAEVRTAQESSSFAAAEQPQSRAKKSDLDTIYNSKQEEITINQRRSPQQKLEPNLPIKFRSSPRQQDDESKEIKSYKPAILSPRSNNNSFFPTEETPDAPIASRLPGKSSQDLSSSNKIHIGAIEIQITPSALPPPNVLPVAKPAIKSTSTASLSRGFTTSFGLRQG